jgi:hydroxymethylpyrimidine pyrophosphatase-like HAD family hydrolase
MGNAVDEVKAVADAIVADNSHDGVAEAIERWVLDHAQG